MNQTINISLPKSMLNDLKDLVAAGHFASVSEAIRAGINHVKTTLHPKYKIPTYPIPDTLDRLISQTNLQIKKKRIMPVKSVSELL